MRKNWPKKSKNCRRTVRSFLKKRSCSTNSFRLLIVKFNNSDSKIRRNICQSNPSNHLTQANANYQGRTIELSENKKNLEIRYQEFQS
jgi:hypothetical protein